MENTKTVIIILAAGSSSRLGQAKQLLAFGESTLLAHSITEAQSITDAAVIVVTGANRDSVERSITGSNILLVYNEQWEQGMGASISKGIGEAEIRFPYLESCIIAVCDQPYVKAALFGQLLVESTVTGKGIVASAYNNTLGTPVLFSNKYFENLKNLNGNEGAKSFLHLYKEDTAQVTFDKGAIDIDTEDDYIKLMSRF